MFRKVADNLYVGDKQAAAEHGHEFDRHISLAAPHDTTTDEFLIPDDETHSYDTFRNAVDVIRSAAFKEGQSTLVNCHAGISRSVSACTAALAVEEEVEFYEALDRCRNGLNRPRPPLKESARRYVREHSDRNPR